MRSLMQCFGFIGCEVGIDGQVEVHQTGRDAGWCLPWALWDSRGLVNAFADPNKHTFTLLSHWAHVFIESYLLKTVLY